MIKTFKIADAFFYDKDGTAWMSDVEWCRPERREVVDGKLGPILQEFKENQNCLAIKVSTLAQRTKKIQSTCTYYFTKEMHATITNFVAFNRTHKRQLDHARMLMKERAALKGTHYIPDEALHKIVNVTAHWIPQIRSSTKYRPCHVLETMNKNDEIAHPLYRGDCVVHRETGMAMACVKPDGKLHRYRNPIAVLSDEPLTIK